MRQPTLWRRQVPAFVFFLHGAVAVRSLLPEAPWPVTQSASVLTQRAVISLTIALLLYLWAGWSVAKDRRQRGAA